MKVKGTAVRVLPEYIKSHYEYLYKSWLDDLPEESYYIFTHPIYATDWYDLYNAHVVPTEVLADVLVEAPDKVAREIGHYSAHQSLKGIYSIFLKLASLKNAIHRVPQFFAAFYRPIEVEILEYHSGYAKIKFGTTKKNESLLYYRNVGWIETLIEMSINPKDIQVDLEVIPKERNPEDYYAIFEINWEL